MIEEHKKDKDEENWPDKKKKKNRFFHQEKNPLFIFLSTEKKLTGD